MADCSSGANAYPSDCQLTEELKRRARGRSEEPLDERTLERARPVKLLLLDVDGVLTDGTLLFSAEEEESKAFNTQDGFGIRLLHEAGVETGVITARRSAAVTRRCHNLKMTHIYQGESDKLVAYNAIALQTGLKPFEICYMGDDWLDLILLKRVGFAAAPANAVAEVRDIAHYTARLYGGAGAVRELCDVILQAKGLHRQLLQSYMNR